MKSDCPTRKEHCPYCGGHDTIAIPANLKALLRGETFWCGYCHSTFTEDMSKRRGREYYQTTDTIS